MKKSILFIGVLVSYLSVSAQFVSTSGPSGGASVSCFLKDGTTLFAGIQSDLYKTIDNGATWTKVTVAADASDFMSLAKAGNFVFAATNNGKVRLYKSSDGGNTWTGVQNGLPQAGGNAVYSPTQMAVIKDTLFLGTTTAGVLKTADFGSNWVATSQGGCTNAVFAKGDTLVVGGAGIGKPKWSANKGATMTDFASDIYKPLPTTAYNNCGAIDYNNGRLFFITSYAAPAFYTDNWGTTIVSSTGVSSPNAIEVAGSKVYASSTDYNKFYVSSDNGSTFSEEKIKGNSMGAYVIYYDGTLVWIGGTTWSATVGTTNFGVINSSVGSGSWQSKNNGLNFMNVTRLASSGNNVFGITASKMYKTTDMGATWSLVDSNLYSNVSADGNNVYACKDMGVSKSTDNGATWTAMSYFNGKAVSAMAADGQTMFAGISGQELWMSTDGGTNWNQKTVASIGTGKIINGFHKHSATVWVAELNTGFAITTDGGTTWTWKNPKNFGGYFATQGTRLLYQRDYEMYVSDNNGITFRTFHTGMPAAPWPVCGGLFIQNNTAYVYNTTSMGLYSLASTDTIWKFIGKTSGMTTYPKIAMISVGGKIFAAPQNGSIWKLDSSASSVENVLQMNNNLINVFPNPSNGVIHIAIKDQPIRSIEVYNILGEKVYQSLNQNQLYTETTIDLTTQKDGIYFVSIKSESGAFIQKLMINH